MNTKLSRLTDLELRSAWKHEAHDFTNWLFENIDRLSEALDLELDVIDKEVEVDQFSADILALDLETNQRMVIENQLTRSDHRHLGQVLTYLAGLDAKGVIWIAESFTDAHLSAIRWLNDHTRDEIAFFGVRLRLVRIGKSPMAPVFDVLEEPNSWNREIQRGEESRASVKRRFWDRYLEKYPGTFRPTSGNNVWIPMLSDRSVLLSMYPGKNNCGMWLRGRFGMDEDEFEQVLSSYQNHLDHALGEGFPSYPVSNEALTIDMEHRWNEIIDWLEGKRSIYEQAFQKARDEASDKRHV